MPGLKEVAGHGYFDEIENDSYIMTLQRNWEGCIEYLSAQEDHLVEPYVHGLKRAHG